MRFHISVFMSTCPGIWCQNIEILNVSDLGGHSVNESTGTKAVQRLPRNSGMFGYFDLLVHTDGVFVMRLQSRSGADAVYSLQFTSRRSDCPAGSIKPWTDCDYLPTRKVMASSHWWRGEVTAVYAVGQDKLQNSQPGCTPPEPSSMQRHRPRDSH